MTAIVQLSQQLSQLSDSLKSTNALITRLSKLSFQPGSEPLDGEGSVRIELAQDIHDSLKQLEEELDLLRQEAEDLTASSTGSVKRQDSDREREKARVSAQVARLGEDLRTSRSQYRRAQLTAKKAAEAAKQKERELVFASLQNAPPPQDLSNSTTSSGRATPDLFAGRRKHAQQKQLTKDELLVDATSNVTAALRRTHDLLSTELTRSRFAQETFDQSTAALAELGEHYTNLDTILSNSRNLLGTLLRSQKSDTWYLETAFYILLATLSWLIFRRILLGPFIRLPLFLLNWFVWKPIYLFLTITGVITTSPATRSAAVSSKSRPPLIVQPSAKGGPLKYAGMMDKDQAHVPGGGGGSNAKVGKDPSLEGKMSEKIGKMAEESERKVREGEGEDDEGEGVVRRGDGTILKERGEEPANPKKKAFEAEEGEGRQRRKRDEL